MKPNKPRKISSFDTRFIVMSFLAMSLYHYGIRFYTDDLQYILRAPYIWTQKSLGYIGAILFQDKVLQNLKKENELLKRQIFLKHNMDTYVPVQHVAVLQYFDTGLTRTLLIPNHLFQTGEIVTAQGYLVGTIISVGKNIATVQLITDPASKIPVVFSDDTIPLEYYGIAIGHDPQSIQIIRLDQRPQNFIPGSIVHTSGIDGLYPKKLRIGQTIGAKKDKIIVNCDLDFKKLDTVEVMRYK